MQRQDFYFELPEALIAQHPCEPRTASRLLYLNSKTQQIQDLKFTHFPDLLKPNDLLVFNDTRVVPARLFGSKATGGKVEILVERVLDDKRILAQIRASKSPKLQTVLHLDQDITAIVEKRVDNFFELIFQDERDTYEILDAIGHIPLPPYIKRDDTHEDKSRYQTVFAKQRGAVAAPTAGLHFDNAILEQIRAKGIETTFVTLHVGAGTFSPIRVADLKDHVMHKERVEVSPQVCEQIKQTKQRGGRVIAIGTTCIRALETASQSGHIEPYYGETNLFITPGYHFNTVDALLTNFHLPESTLLMLVCALAGQQAVLNAYQHAVTKKYRFFSYGDAMFTLTYTA